MRPGGQSKALAWCWCPALGAADSGCHCPSQNRRMICPGSVRFRQVCRRCAHSSRGGCGTWALGLRELPVTQSEPGPSLGEHEMSELQRSQQNFVPPLSGPANDHGLSSPCKVTRTAAALARGNSSSFPPLPARSVHREHGRGV